MLYPDELQALHHKNGRGGEIRTPDPLLPKQLRYQAALHPDYTKQIKLSRPSLFYLLIGKSNV